MSDLSAFAKAKENLKLYPNHAMEHLHSHFRNLFSLCVFGEFLTGVRAKGYTMYTHISEDEHTKKLRLWCLP